jgi:RNA polymerase-interacting CarD/CdnL/TRCF family regulator
MQFSVGDKIVHPYYGAGRIVDLEQRRLVEGFEDYYVIELLVHGSTLYIPHCRMEELGVRLAMSQTKLGEVLDILCDMPRRLSRDFKKRQGRVREKLQTGCSVQIAEAVRDLACHKRRKRLTKKDQDLLNQGRELLAAEMAVATNTEMLDTQERIDAALEVAMKREFATSKKAQLAQ